MKHEFVKSLFQDFHSYVTIFESFLGRKNVSQLAAYVLEICNTHQPTTLVGKGNSWYSQVRHGNDADASQYFVTHLYKNLGLYSQVKKYFCLRSLLIIYRGFFFSEQDEAERVVGLMATDGKQNLDDEDYINHLMTVWYEIGQTHPGSLKKQKSLITDWRRKPQYAVKAQQLLDLMENRYLPR